MAKKETAADAAAVEAMSFEQALGELETIVGRLEDGAVDLDESIRLYERGTALKAHCEAKLKSAEARIEKIVTSSSGAVSAEAADIA